MRTGTTLVFLSLAAFFLAPQTAAAEELYLSVDFEPPVHSTLATGDVLEVPGTELFGHPGEPLLPHKALYFLLPYGHTPVDVRLVALVVEPVDGNYDITPAQRPVPLSKMHLLRPTPPDALIYGHTEPFPGTWMQTGSIQFKHGYAMLPVILHPLSYHPRSGLVNRIASVTVVLTTKPGGRISPLLRVEPDDADAVARLADVVTYVHSYPRMVPYGPTQLEPGDYQYVIITPQVFVGLGGANSLEALRDARIAGGLTARIETLEWIQANYDGSRPDGGQDDATRVRQFLQDAHNEWGTQFVLLVGDADADDVGGESGDLLMPVRGVWVDGGPDIRDFLPADQYYSCLDGSYDHNANGYYGEEWDGPTGGEVDLLAELYVGRAPADGAEEVQNFVAKTLAYEQGAGNWLKEVWMLGEWLFDGPIWGGDAMDELITGTNIGGFTTLGFDSFGFYDCHPLYDRDAGQADAWDASDLLPILNNGPHIVNHLGHSASYWNMRMTISEVDGLFNTRPFLHYSQGCYNGSFDNLMASEAGGTVSAQDCFAEHMLLGEHGAFATMSNSRYGLGSGMGTDGPSQRFHRQFWDAFFAEGAATIGEAFADCKDDNASGYSAVGIRWAGFTVNLLGDPAVALKKSINTTDPLLGVYPPGFRFFSKVGDPPPEPAELRVRNDGVGQLSYTAMADQAWISLTPDSGSAPEDLELQVDLTSLAPGAHEGVVMVSSPEAPNSPVEVTVEQIVINVPELRLPHIEPAPTVDGEIADGEYDGALQLPIDSEGTGEVTLYFAVSENQLHLAVDDLTDITDGGDQLLFIFDKDLNELWPTAPGDEGVYWQFGRRPYFVPIYNPGGGYETANWNFWDEYPEGFEVVRGFSAGHRVYEISLNLDTSRLDVGRYGAFGMYFQVRDTIDWNIQETTGHWPPWVPEIDDQRFFGKLDLAPEGSRLDSAPTSLLFNAIVDGTPPDPINLSVFDREGGTIAYTASTSVSWLSVTPGAGQTPGELTVSVDQSGVPIGDNPGTVIIEGNTWNSPFEVPVILRIWGEPAHLSLDPTALHITAAKEAPNPVTTFTASNLGGRPMEFVITASENWILRNPREGAMGPFASRTVEVTADLSKLDAGTHQGEITVRGIMAEGSPATVSIQVDVVSPRPVPPVEELNLGALDSALQLTWTCPDDPIISGVLIRKGLVEPPEDPRFGETVYDGMEERHTDEGLTNGTRYCYSAFAHDSAGRYAEPATACGKPGPNLPPPMPELLSPANGGVVPATPELVASTVVDPNGDVVAYTFVLLDSAGTLDSEVIGGSGNRVSWLPNAELEPEVSYRWQVEAIDQHGAHSGFSPARSFIIRPTQDGGTDGGQPPDDPGPDCGCGGSNTSSPWLLLCIAGLMLLVRRRSN